MRKNLFAIIAALAIGMSDIAANPKIDRVALVERNSPTITAIDSLSSLTVGNGSFALTVDATGLQSYPEQYANGIPLNAMSDWAWHSFPNTKGLRREETERTLDLGHGHKETYAVEYKKAGRNREATEYFRVNPHRLALGTVGLLFTDGKGKKLGSDQLKDIQQRLDLWNGIIESNYKISNKDVKVYTASLTDRSGFYSKIESPLIARGQAKVTLRFSYPTGKHSDDGNDWSKPSLHKSTIIERSARSATIERRLDSTLYYIYIAWEGDADLKAVGNHEFRLSSKGESLSFRVIYSPTKRNDFDAYSFAEAKEKTSNYWHDYWQRGAAVDFSDCTNPRAKELERRVVLSQYLTAINCANQMPPQETGLTYNSWFGRPHLEMTFWHSVHFALWGRPEILRPILQWYNDKAAPVARAIAERQGFKGIRWMKMTDPEVGEAPSNVGSFLLWQQPHYIYMAEEMYRANPTPETLALYADNVEATAEFVADFARSCAPKDGGQIKLFGATAMQESMSKDFSFNHPFEQAYWHYALTMAQQWRERQGKPRRTDWDEIISRLAPLESVDGIYQSGEPLDSCVIPSDKSRSDHPAVLGVAGIFPTSPLYDKATMEKTLEWVMDNWNWATTWGWDYGMVAMCATSVGRPDIAVKALLIDKTKNTYLANGHNYQEPKRLRLYLPGNGALLTAVAMMCAGWEGSNTVNPGFPDDGTWNVKWEGLKKLQATLAQPNYDFSKLQRERLGRGIVALRESSDSVAVSWRYLSSDPMETKFNLYRNGKLIKTTNPNEGTFVKDGYMSTKTITYTVKPVVNGKEDNAQVASYIMPANAPIGYINIPLNRPKNGVTPDGEKYDYTPGDATIGDVDGDGNYEIIFKWDPSNAHDNAHDGYTGNVYVDCYRLSGEQLWRIDLGRNIRAGAHYTQIMLFDLDGDGKAEVVMKTADGTIDGTGTVIGDKDANYVGSEGRLRGRIVSGPEYLTIFKGLTGKAMATVNYIPERGGNGSAWGDDHGNRCERYLACVAYLDGVHPSVVMCRGYYTRAVLAAFDWDGKTLSNRWTFDSDDEGNSAYAGQGNHNLRVADVDGDGRDEIVYGSMTIDDNGKGLYSTGLGHGDAMHLTQFEANNPKLQVWACHEDKRDGSTFRDAATGKIIFQVPDKTDVGRCMAADIDPTSPGVEMWSLASGGLRSPKGELLSPERWENFSCNMAVWWDGDLLRELLDRNMVTKYNWKEKRCDLLQRFYRASSINGTKAVPCLQGDIIGDWREEVLLRADDNENLRLYVTTIPTQYRFHTFLEDPVYRISIATENVAYNQPTQPGFYFGPDLKGTFRGYDLKVKR